MSAKRFVAADMRRALELVREQLGPDAIILSNRRVKEGVELICSLEAEPTLPAKQRAHAVSSSDVAEQSPLTSDGAWAHESHSNRFKPIAEPRLDDGPTESAQLTKPFSGISKSGADIAADIEKARERMLAAESKRVGQQSEHPQFQDKEPTLVAKPELSTQLQDQQLDDMKSELADLRELLELQLGRSTTTSQSKNTIEGYLHPLLTRFERLGLPLHLSSKVLNELSMSQSDDMTKSARELWPEALSALANEIPVSGDDLTDAGGVFAFVGPTGVGKTTTIGKLAARYVLKHGADKVALITTDTYRIAAHDQLKTLGRILNIDVKVVEHLQALPSVLAGVTDKSLVLIDTAGFRHGDPLLKEQLRALNSNLLIKKLLVLSCNSQVQMLKASMHAYKSSGIKAVVLSKLDESASLGETLGLMIEAKIPIAYTTDGQEIPKDIQVARANQLVADSVHLAKQIGYSDIGTA